MDTTRFDINTLFRELSDGEREFRKPPYDNHIVEVHQNDKLHPNEEEIFGEQGGLKGRTLYEVDDRGSFITDSNGTVRWVETDYGADRKSKNVELNKLRKGCVYKVGPNKSQRNSGYSFTHWFMTHPSEDDGGVIYAGTDYFNMSNVSSGERFYDNDHEDLIAPAGSGYDKGHLIAREFGAGSENINLVSMMRESNQWRTTRTMKRISRETHNEAKKTLADLRLDSEDTDIKDPWKTYMHLRQNEHDERVIPNYRFFEQMAKAIMKTGKYDVKLVIPSIVTVWAPDEMLATSILYPRIKLRLQSSNEPCKTPLKFAVDIDTKNHHETEE